MMRSVTAAIRRPAALGRNHPAVSSSKLFSSDSSPSSSSSSYNAESAARTLKLLERRKVSTLDIGIFKRKKKPITMVTAYDYPSAVHVDLAGFDILLVGDSLGMVELGMDTTLPVTLDDMIHHTQAVKRGATRPLVITDMPFGTCEGTPFEALKNAQRLMKEGAKRFATVKRCKAAEGGADCVKIEGGKERAETSTRAALVVVVTVFLMLTEVYCDTVKTIVDGGIAVMGHIGLRPQHISVLGGFRAQGRTASQARMIIEDALAVQKAGAFAVVLECVPSAVAKAVTELLKIPTIGIGAGPETDGQVLVFHDLLGMLQHPHHAQFVPKFCKRYADVGEQIRVGLENYRDDVETGRFSSEAFSPYKMSKEETQKLHDMMATEYSHKDDDEDDGATHSEVTKVY
ncbi:Pyruvate/Phosphoenolpyruvate kinase-like domain [Phytophthora cactorum]|nr:Pyruvate/Phosphoenolpyruvate kinase-like domain [Phytophthora cactorum]KAF1784965.1 Pyruvate/Phosphoenolpyruvate kinase-like domain [Phytophthora cactorum]